MLPKDGSWSVVQHHQGTGEVSPLDPQATVPLIRRGRHSTRKRGRPTPRPTICCASPIRSISCRRPVRTRATIGLLQSTGTQKALFRRPSFTARASTELLGAPPDFADAYRIVNSPAIFPNVQDALPLALGAFKTKILAEGYRLIDEANPAKVFEQVLPTGPLYLINEKFLKLYVEYAKKDKDGNRPSDGRVCISASTRRRRTSAKKWLSKVNDIGMVVDLGPLTRLMMIKGKFDAEKGQAPGLRRAAARVQRRAQAGDRHSPDPARCSRGAITRRAFQKGLEIAMSNSADSWNYAFHARKEIPIVKFPPGRALRQSARTRSSSKPTWPSASTSTRR